MTKTNTKSIRLNPQTEAIYLKDYGSAYAGATRAAESFLWLKRSSLKGLKGKLSRQELTALVDSFKWSIFEEQYAIHHNMLIGHIEDSNQFESLGDRWGIDIPALIEKVNSMSIAEIFFLQEEIDRFWNVECAFGAPNPNLEKFLDTLT